MSEQEVAPQNQKSGQPPHTPIEAPIPSLLIDLCNNLPAAVFLLSFEMDEGEPLVLYANLQARNLWRADLEALVGQSAGGVFKGLGDSESQARWRELRRTGRLVFHARFITTGNHVVQARMSAQRFICYGYDYYLTFVCPPNVTCVTTTHEIPIAVQQVLQSANLMPLYLKDLNGEYVGYTHDTEELVGVAPGGSEGKTAWELFTSQVARQVEMQDRSVLAGNEWLAYPFVARTKDSELRELMLYKTRVEAADGSPVGVMGIIVSPGAYPNPLGREAQSDISLDSLAGTEQLELTDLFDVKELQDLQDTFAYATGVATLLTRADGTPITTQSNFCRLCSQVIRVSEKGRQRCMHSDSQLGKFNPHGPTIQPCLSAGLWGAGASININGRHVASWLVGQIKNEELDEAKVLNYAHEIDVDPEEFARAYAEIKQMPLEQFKKIADLVYMLSNWLSEQAYQNLLQARHIIAQQQAERLLRESQERLELAARSTGLGVWDWDILSNQFTWDSTVYEIHGIKRNKSENLFDAFTARLYPDDRERVLREINSVLAGTREFSSTYRIRLDDGVIRHIAVEGRVMCDASGQPQRVVGINRDITEEMNAATEQQRLEHQLRQSQKLEAVGTLAGGIAHDFNNILFAILGNTEIALDELPASHHLHACVLEIQHAAQRAGTLVKQLLSFSRPSEVVRQPVVIGDVIRDVVALVRSSAPPTITVEARTGRDDLVVLADTTELHQILLNLCTNAYQAMLETGGKLSIGAVQHVETMVSPLHVSNQLLPGQYVKLSVSDTGTGIPSEIRDRIFEPFFTTRAIDKGKGMGLSVVHGLVASMGGRIRVDSEIGKGTTFYLYLPLYPKPDEGDSLQVSSVIPHGHNERILLVDDEPAITQLMTSMLTSLGYRVDAYYNPQLALEAFGREPQGYKLVLTDLTMPGITGDEVYRRIRRQHPRLPVIITSGNRQNVLMDPAQSLEQCLVLDKPIERNTLAHAVASLLNETKNP